MVLTGERSGENGAPTKDDPRWDDPSLSDAVSTDLRGFVVVVVVVGRRSRLGRTTTS
jgi:hypothetical protein